MQCHSVGSPAPNNVSTTASSHSSSAVTLDQSSDPTENAAGKL